MNVVSALMKDGGDGKYFKDVMWLIFAVIYNNCKIKYLYLLGFRFGL